MLSEQGYRVLLDNLPDVAQFKRVFGVKRSHGQQPHDRFVLECRDDLPIAPCWHDFVAELRGERYCGFVQRMFRRGNFQLSFHWQSTPAGCSVAPHCDATHKLGSHIFYVNSRDEWDPDWGGENLILDDGGRFKRNSAPPFEDFIQIAAGENLGNNSLLFQRQGNSWHGVREIRCPEDRLRKVFIVVINDRKRAWLRRLIGWIKRKPGHDY